MSSAKPAPVLSTEVGLRYNEYGFTGGNTRVRAQSIAELQLIYQLESYLDRKVSGRACLIAGNRGSGKTTLIDTVMKLVGRERGVRLLFVRAHGPSLLERPAQAESTTQPAAPTVLVQNMYTPLPMPAPTAQEAKKQADAIKQQEEYEVSAEALRLLIIALYQAAADELSAAYTQFVSSNQEMREMAAQLRISLDGAPPLSTLRYFWNKAGALEQGVLPKPSTIDVKPGAGMRELVALASAAEAYRSCIGKYQRTMTDATSATQKLELKQEMTARTKELAHALVSILGGTVVGAGAAAEFGPLPGALGGVITALASMLTLGYTSVTSRDSSQSDEIKFLPDTTVASLVHRMPQLVQRLFEAGLVPIFVIDELDKLHGRTDELNALVGYLKYMCADRAFFCFLTDRNYLVDVSKILKGKVNPKESTIFTNRMFLVHHPSSFHEFLRQVIRPDGAVDEAQRINLELDAEALRYVLILRSKMLVFNLVGELGRLRNRNGWLRIALQEPREKFVHRYMVMIQLAIELVLTSPTLSQRIASDPEFGQIAYDALYYPVDRWTKGYESLDCSKETLLAGVTTLAAGALELDDNDGDLLYLSVHSLMSLITQPATLKADVTDAVANQRMNVSPHIVEVIPLDPPLIVKTPADDTYKWRYTSFGNPFQPSEAGKVLEGLDEQTLFLDAFEKALQSAIPEPFDAGSSNPFTLEKLADAYGMLPKTPSWHSMRQSRNRLEKLQSSPQDVYSEMESDRSNVDAYAAMVRRLSKTIVEALCLCLHLARYSSSTTGAERFNVALGRFCNVLRLQMKPELTTTSIVEELFSTVFGGDIAVPALPDRGVLESWAEAVKDLTGWAALREGPEKSATIAAAWDAWRHRFLTFFQPGRPQVGPDISYLRCAIDNELPARILTPWLNEATLPEWSDAIVAALRTAETWFVEECLRGLGFREASPMEQRSSRSGQALLVLRSAAGSITENWPISRDTPVFAPTWTDFQETFPNEGLALSKEFVAGVLIEPGRNSDLRPFQGPAGADVLRVVMDRFGTGVRVGLLLSEHQAAPEGFSRAFTPKSAAEALKQAFGDAPAEAL